MTDNVPHEIADPNAIGADPDDRTVVVPRRNAAPAAVPAAEVIAVAAVPAPVVEPYVAPAAAAPTPHQPQPPRRLSVTSMVLGIGGLILSFFGVGFFVVVAAVVTGHLAAGRQRYAKPFWLTGIITGYVGIGFSLVYGAIWVNYFLHLFGIIS